MILTAYRTDLDPEHKRVSANTANYLWRLSIDETRQNVWNYDIRSVVCGARSLTVELPTNRAINYACLTDGAGDDYYYFMHASKITPLTSTYLLTIDDWAMATRGLASPIISRGTQVMGHDMAFYGAPCHFPIDPIVEHLETTRVISFKDGDENKFGFAINLSIKDGDTERNVIVTTGYFDTNPINIAVNAAALIAKATYVDYGGKSYQITSLNEIIVLPQFVGLPAPSGSGALLASNDATDKLLNIGVFTGCILETVTLDGYSFYKNGDDIVPVIIEHGNFGANVVNENDGVMRNGQTFLKYWIDFVNANISVTLWCGNQDVDMKPSLSVGVSALRSAPNILQQKISDTLALVGDAVMIGGGIVAQNPNALIGGVTGAASHIGNMAARTNFNRASKEGDGISNMYFGGTANMLYVGAYGYMIYTLANAAQIMDAIARFGYRFEIPRTNVTLKEALWRQPKGTWLRGTYRQFIDVEIAPTSVEPQYIDTITQMCLNGFTIYDEPRSVTLPVNFGVPFNLEYRVLE